MILANEEAAADHRRMMMQYIGQKVPLHEGAPDGPVIGEATIVGIDWEHNVFLADFDVTTEQTIFTNVTEEAHP